VGGMASRQQVSGRVMSSEMPAAAAAIIPSPELLPLPCCSDGGSAHVWRHHAAGRAQQRAQLAAHHRWALSCAASTNWSAAGDCILAGVDACRLISPCPCCASTWLRESTLCSHALCAACCHPNRLLAYPRLPTCADLTHSPAFLARSPLFSAAMRLRDAADWSYPGSTLTTPTTQAAGCAPPRYALPR